MDFLYLNYKYKNRLSTWLSGKESTCPPGDSGSSPESGGSPGKGNVNPLQYSCPGKPLDRGSWWATVHGDAEESDTTWQLNDNNINAEK